MVLPAIKNTCLRFDRVERDIVPFKSIFAASLLIPYVIAIIATSGSPTTPVSERVTIAL